jgi:hypothetical protein
VKLFARATAVVISWHAVLPGFDVPVVIPGQQQIWADDQPAATRFDGTMVTGNGTTARYSSPPMT